MTDRVHRLVGKDSELFKLKIVVLNSSLKNTAIYSNLLARPLCHP